ncbi:hypothetical protein GP665_24715 [Escherichia coli]|nr:hypothetical protein GP665_24715 [Escherichia coli]
MGQQRGRLTPLPERQKIINLVSEAVSSGARKTQACQCIGISVRTLQRWMQGGVVHADQRPGASRRKRKLTAVCSHQTRIGNLDAHLI